MNWQKKCTIQYPRCLYCKSTTLLASFPLFFPCETLSPDNERRASEAAGREKRLGCPDGSSHGRHFRPPELPLAPCWGGGLAYRQGLQSRVEWAQLTKTAHRDSMCLLWHFTASFALNSIQRHSRPIFIFRSITLSNMRNVSVWVNFATGKYPGEPDRYPLWLCCFDPAFSGQWRV